MKRVVVVTTGGTIASRRTGAGFAAEATGRDVLSTANVPYGVTCEVVDLYTVNSARLTTSQQLHLLHTVHEALADPAVDGVVVAHGTDTMEESAFLLDLFHADRRPVVFTGAQRPLTEPRSDAGRNLTDAIRVAAEVRDRGVLIAFDGLVHAARGTVKTQTLALGAFGDPSGSPLGRTSELPAVHRQPRPAALSLPNVHRRIPRVDILMHHCDADTTLFDAAIGAGAEGIVLVGTGAGNATPAFAAAVSRAVSAGVLVALCTRVAAGPVTPMYTEGGGVDLVAEGAVPTGTLRAAQARIAVLAALLCTPGMDSGARTATLRQLIAAPITEERIALRT